MHGAGGDSLQSVLDLGAGRLNAVPAAWGCQGWEQCPEGLARTTEGLLVQVLQHTVTAGRNPSARALGQAPMGWAWKSWAGAQPGAGRVAVPAHLDTSVPRDRACEAQQRSSELGSPCIWELRAWPHSSQHSRMPVPCHLVPACNTCHESANLLPPGSLLLPGIRVLQVPGLHPRNALPCGVHPRPGGRRA